MLENYPQTAQGQATPATAEDITRDNAGITNPNLHRRIDNSLGDIPITFSDYLIASEDDHILISGDAFEFLTENTDSESTIYPKAEYVISVSGVNSYRITKTNPHNEESEDSEIP